MAASAREEPTLPRGPFDFAPISSVTSLLSAGRRIPARRIARIQRSVWATQSRAKRRAEKGQRSSTPALWQISMSTWRTLAARAARKRGSGEICRSGCRSEERRVGKESREEGATKGGEDKGRV